MDWNIAIGFCAATLTTGAFLPQVIKTIRTKQTKDLSLLMYVMLTMGIGMWIAYGITRWDVPIIIANIIALCFNVVVLILKMKYR